jgi:prepilin-type processing-associated H-X9-DG protein
MADDNPPRPLSYASLGTAHRSRTAGVLCAVGSVSGTLSLGFILLLRFSHDIEELTVMTLLSLIGAVAAIGFGVVGAGRKDAGSLQRKFRIAPLLIGGISLATCLPVAHKYAKQFSSAVPCAQNLSHVGLGLFEYAQANGGNLPRRLEDLVISGTLDANRLLCVESNDTPAKGTTPAGFTAEYRLPGHVSFIYLGSGKKATDFSGSDILAYEPPAYHGGTGANVLYGDGHVNFVSTGELNQALAPALSATHPTTTVTTQITQ